MKARVKKEDLVVDGSKMTQERRAELCRWLYQDYYRLLHNQQPQGTPLAGYYKAPKKFIK